MLKAWQQDSVAGIAGVHAASRGFAWPGPGSGVEGEGTLTFWWKASSQNNKDWLEFRLDDALEDRISGDVDWSYESYSISSGTHTLKWRYVKDSSDPCRADCGWVDYVQWSGPGAELDPNVLPTQWDQLTYEYDPSGRRIEKAYDGATVVKYLYDSDHCIAEYDGNDELLRKYIYGPGVDQPICMIDVNDSNAVYYYHFDGLGSVVALSDSSGDTVQVYEYSVFGQVAASDPNHTNPFLFTGRRFDSETGLYYYRARYYNPYIGRFLQTDPVGYADGMNVYRYCRNNPVNARDSSGLVSSLHYAALMDPAIIAETIFLETGMELSLGVSAVINLYGLRFVANWAATQVVAKCTFAHLVHFIGDTGNMTMIKAVIKNDAFWDPEHWDEYSPLLNKIFEDADGTRRFFRHKFPKSRFYSVHEAERLFLEAWSHFGIKPPVDPPHRGWDHHMHFSFRDDEGNVHRGRHCPITREAYEYLIHVYY